jgi:hypothetical protein
MIQSRRFKNLGGRLTRSKNSTVSVPRDDAPGFVTPSSASQQMSLATSPAEPANSHDDSCEYKCRGRLRDRGGARGLTALITSHSRIEISWFAVFARLAFRACRGPPNQEYKRQ